MGLIRDLIQDHRQKKQQDFDQNFTKWATLAQNEGLDPSSRQIVNDNIATLLGGETGVPKQHHGLLSKLIGGMHDHLASLNPSPKDEWKDRLKPLAAGPATKGMSDVGGLTGVPENLPGAPAYHPITEENARKYREQQADVVRQSKAADLISTADAERAAADKDLENKINRLKQNKEAVGASDYQDALASLIAQRSIGHSGLGAHAPQKSQRIIVMGEDGKPQPANAYLSVDESGERAWFDEKTRQPIPSARLVNTNPPREQAEPAALRTLEDSYRILLDPKSDPAKRAAATRVIQNSNASLEQKGISYQRASQGIQEEAEISGGIAGSKMPNIPNVSGMNGSTAGTLAGTPANTKGTGKSEAANISGSESSRTPVSNVSTGTRQLNGTGVGSTPNANANANANSSTMPGKVSVAQASKDPDVQFWLNDIAQRAAGITSRSGGGKGAQARISKATRKFYQMTGLDPMVVSANLMEKGGLRDALKKNTDALSAFDRLGSRLENMGNLLTEAMQKMPKHGPAYNKLLQHIRTEYTGDPDTRAYVLALAEFRKEYASVISNSYMSVAQTPIGAAEDLNKKIPDFIEQDSLPAVLDLVQKARQQNTQSFIDQNQKLFAAAASPIGGESSVAKTFTESGSGTGVNNQKSGKNNPHMEWGEKNKSNPQQRRYTHDGGKTWSISNDGGKTWSEARAM